MIGGHKQLVHRMNRTVGDHSNHRQVIANHSSPELSDRNVTGCASHVGMSAVSCQNSCVAGCGTVSTDTRIGPTSVIRTCESGISTNSTDRQLQRRRANHRENSEGIGGDLRTSYRIDS